MSLVSRLTQLSLPLTLVPFHLRHWKWFRLAVLGGADCCILLLSYYLAFLLRLDSWALEGHFASFVTTSPIFVITHMIVFHQLGMYRQVWRYANLNSAILIGRCVLFATLVSLALCYVFARDVLPPRSVPIIFIMMAFVLVTVTKFSWRAWTSALEVAKSSKKPSCLIYGAGQAGDLLARHIQVTSNFPYRPIGFIDDDANKKGRLIHGLRILGDGKTLAEFKSRLDFDHVLIAMNSASGNTIRKVVDQCRIAGIHAQIMPEMASALGSDLCRPRPIDIRDLLRRQAASLDRELVINFFRAQSVLVTGAGGTIGSEVCRQVLECQPSRLILFDVSEYNIYKLEKELRQLNQGATVIHPVVGSASDRRCVERLFKKFQITHVLHAAAYKHVPLMECNISEAIINNVQGTKTVAEVAVRNGVRHFLLVSTDKAVRPTNVMGATKRCCELVIQALAAKHPSCRFTAVRFGNVLNSSGSVVPLFIEQIKNGGPVTVTHPDVTRYFMLISEAVGLILQSCAMAQGGETFILDMGEPVKIVDMAEQLIILAGKEPYKDIDIEFTGLRPGEKIYEELLKEDAEDQLFTGGVYVARPRPLQVVDVVSVIEDLIGSAEIGDEAACIDLLRKVGDLNRSPAGATVRQLPVVRHGEASMH